MSQRQGNRPAHIHRPVMLHEVLREMVPEPKQIIVDGTLGAAGHSRHIVQKISPAGTLIGIDRDSMMLELAQQQLATTNVDDVSIFTHQASYAQLGEILAAESIASVDAILVDLGLSSDQLADEQRGFGFQTSAPLDLRFDTSTGKPASDFLAKADAQEIVRVFREYGEERHAQRIADHIVSARRQQPIETTDDLVQAVISAVPKNSGNKHPATRVFQALRIYVNKELEQLISALESAFFQALRPGGRLLALTFHSLEDRLVKDEFRRQERWKNLTTKPITATPAETRANPRSRSAKLRVAMRK